ncbi:hypothetical protein I2485_06870 [Nesterenkonia sp. E16_7]|uniref:hypothetical protein n=1 Tax=unclassified Nesterenkonia TaxID=2629769 RepID=UPI001A91F311|nr:MULTISPECIES: hypothetical protein [unclassified Nesterenkonia]MBO0596597.1 hypothetical protein [Nesterenkonia sp. E16_10]MBO0598374.1 hypothetical protein [Nesterenkonia sp. E16_7]
MRLQRPIYAQKPVEEIRLRIRARDIPSSAHLDVTDVQLQPGEDSTAVVPNPREAGTTAGGVQYRNGVVNGDMEVVALTNLDRATPTRVELHNVAGEARVGSYRFGSFTGDAYVDGEEGAASRGWGRAPIITQRSDLTLRSSTERRMHIRLRWRDRGA